MKTSTNSTKSRFKCTPSVFLYFTREGENGKEVLLQLRQNTGYMDGRYHFGVAGHVEAGETFAAAAIRETAEEIGIEILPEDLTLDYIYYGLDDAYINFVFGVKNFSGTPQILEPNKCAELAWINIDKMPENVAPYLPGIIRDIEKGIKFNHDIL